MHTNSKRFLITYKQKSAREWKTIIFIKIDNDYRLHCYVQVLYYNILMRDEAIHAVVAAFPPVFRCSVIQKERCPLLEWQLPGTTAHVVKLSDGLNLLNLWNTQTSEAMSKKWSNTWLLSNLRYKQGSKSSTSVTRIKMIYNLGFTIFF